ncbi:MAG: endo-1,4-beta-xylanase [Caulobacteraceae bacterium]
MIRDETSPSARPRLIDRRTLLASTLALGACGRGAQAADPTYPHDSGPPPLLRDLAPFPIGTEIITDQLGDPVFAALASRQFSQVTAGYELKMEYILRPDGAMRFEGGDRVAGFCRDNGQGLHAHCLIWYIDNPKAFQPPVGNPAAFGRAYDRYISTVAGRYAGQAVGWDVVNEPIADDGVTLRQSLWTRELGMEGYFIRAFDEARAADPHAVLLVNEYDLETKPQKRLTFLKLVEAMLKRGAPIGGIGHQSHISINLEPGVITTAMRDIASLGLPVHVSEFDVSLQGKKFDLRSRDDKLAIQARLYHEAVEAYMALPKRQQYGFTLWGVRDKETWLRLPQMSKDPTDAPLPFDDDGQPKPAFWAMVDALDQKRG